MKIKIKFPLFLQMFADGGAEGGATAAAEGAAEGTQPETPAEPPQETAEQRKARYDAALAEFKDLDDQRMERAVKNRLRQFNKTTNELNALQEAVAPLFAAHGIDPGDVDGLKNAIASDNSYWERGAEQAGMTPEQYRQMQMTAAENRRLNAIIGQQQAEQAANRQLAAWQQEAEQLKTKYPAFDLMTEIQNPVFASLITSKNPTTRLSLEAAYQATHAQELITQASAAAAQQAEQNVANTIRANGQRPREAGAGSASAAKPGRIDPKTLTKKQMLELEMRASRGEKITFT